MLTCAPSRLCTILVCMDRLRETLRAAIEAAPCSVRKLADQAGLAHTTLLRIQTGAMRPTPAVARKVAEALETWSEECGEAAARLRDELAKIQREEGEQ